MMNNRPITIDVVLLTGHPLFRYRSNSIPQDGDTISIPDKLLGSPLSTTIKKFMVISAVDHSITGDNMLSLIQGTITVHVRREN